MFWQGGATKSAATNNSRPEPGPSGVSPPSRTSVSHDPFLLTSQLNHTIGKRSRHETCVKTQQDSLQGADALCSCSSKWLSISRITSQRRRTFHIPAGDRFSISERALWCSYKRCNVTKTSKHSNFAPVYFSGTQHGGDRTVPLHLPRRVACFRAQDNVQSARCKACVHKERPFSALSSIWKKSQTSRRGTVLDAPVF